MFSAKTLYSLTEINGFFDASLLHNYMDVIGISVPVALFSFMGSIMAGIFANIVNFKQYQTIYAGFNPAAESYTYNDYFQIGMIGMIVSLVVVLTVANISMNKKKRYAMAANVPAEGGDAPMISWLAVLLPVLGSFF